MVNMRACGHLDEAVIVPLSFIASNILPSHCHSVLELFAKHN